MGFFAGLASLITRAVGRRKLTSRVDATLEQSLWLQPGRIGGQLTPETLSNIIVYADQGYLYQLVDLFDECRQKDCHLHAILSTFELSLALLEVQVIPASTKRKDVKIAQWVEAFLDDFGSRYDSTRGYDLSSLIQHLAGGYVYSHAVAEIVWERRNGDLIPIGAEPVMPRRFAYDPDRQELRFCDVAGAGYGSANTGIDLRKEYPNHYIQFQPRVTGAIPSREGLARLLVWAALFRNWAMRDWLTLAELAWKPWRIGQYDKAAYSSREDIAALQQALQYLVTTGATLLPKNVDLKIEYAKQTGSSSSSSPHEALKRFLAEEMSKAVLGQTMTTEDGSSRSQAQVHRRVQGDRRTAAAKAIAHILRRQLVANAVRLNFGPTALVPHIHLAGQDDVDLAALAQAIERLVGLGLPVSIPWIYKLYGMPTPKTGEAVIGPPTPGVVPAENERMRIARERLRIASVARQRVALLDGPEGDDLREEIEDEARAEIDRAIAREQRLV